MKGPSFLKQKNMLRVLYALIPVLLAGIYYFGWRVVAVLAVTAAASVLTEWFMVAKRKGKVSYACFVTAALLGLALPPTIPYWMAAVGGVVAILFAKEAFGGFGKNVFNPAVVGRAFLYVCFPLSMTAGFVPTFSGFPGGFAHWSFATQSGVPSFLTQAGLKLADAVTAATPMLAHRDFGFATSHLSLLLGSIGGVFEFNGHPMALGAGSIGEVSAVAILVGAAILLFTGTASWRLMLSTILGAVAMNVLLRTVLGIQDVPPLAFSLLCGALLYGAVFMVTDPVSAPKKVPAQWLYGLFIGAMVVFLRYKSVFVGSVAFAILLGNIVGPSFDLWFAKRTKPAAPGAKT